MSWTLNEGLVDHTPLHCCLFWVCYEAAHNRKRGVTQSARDVNRDVSLSYRAIKQKGATGHKATEGEGRWFWSRPKQNKAETQRVSKTARGSAPRAQPDDRASGMKHRAAGLSRLFEVWARRQEEPRQASWEKKNSGHNMVSLS